MMRDFPVFAQAFAWCSPDAYRALTWRDYTSLRRHLAAQANEPTEGERKLAELRRKGAREREGVIADAARMRAAQSGGD